MNDRRTRPTSLPSAASAACWRLCGSMPSRQTRVSSAPKTVSTAPAASAPSRCVRPDGLRPASTASLSRLPLVALAMSTPLGEHVGLVQLPEEDPAEPCQSAEPGDDPAPARPERGQLLGEVAHADPQHAGRHELRAVVLLGLHVAAQDAREE